MTASVAEDGGGGRGEREGGPVDASDRVRRRGRDSGETTPSPHELKKKKIQGFEVLRC